MAASVIETRSKNFLGDTGASLHIFDKGKYLIDLTPLPGLFKIYQGQGTFSITHWGTVIVEVDSASGKKPLRLTDVLFIDSMTFNILSMQKIRAAGSIPVYNEVPDKVVIKKLLPEGGLEQVALMSETKQGRLTFDFKIIRAYPQVPSIRHAETLGNTFSMDLLHRRLGHSGQAALQRLLQDNVAPGISIVSGSSIDPCGPCRLGKLTRPPHPAVVFDHNTTYALEPLDVSSGHAAESGGESIMIIQYYNK